MRTAFSLKKEIYCLSLDRLNFNLCLLIIEILDGLKMQKFDYTLDFKSLDFRQQPELYRIGKGEQGVLLVQPYKRVFEKSVLLPIHPRESPCLVVFLRHGGTPK
jgi:Domain of unknown function (DUF4385)